MRTLNIMLGLAAALTAAGCGDETHMRDYAASLGEHITVVEIETNTHNIQVGGGADLARLRGVEDDHLAAMRGHMRQMEHMTADMTICLREWGDRADARGFYAGMGSMQREWEDHHGAMRAAPDLTLARAEEVRHQSMMSGLFDPMRRQYRSMMDGAGSFGCGMHDDD